ncbi:hypothetical protein BKA70DRAFT_1440061 [Coprinopsis sp. MPI-PUGE-AT-0042]|nr:hypothetical protein BKA70DRAFT_1440061 [Coprinopsis sp. MPI-PUGE-AT-0042]
MAADMGSAPTDGTTSTAPGIPALNVELLDGRRKAVFPTNCGARGQPPAESSRQDDSNAAKTLPSIATNSSSTKFTFGSPSSAPLWPADPSSVPAPTTAPITAPKPTTAPAISKDTAPAPRLGRPIASGSHSDKQPPPAVSPQKDSGKHKQKSEWMPFDSEEEAIQWALNLSATASRKVMQALATNGMEIEPPPFAPHVKWSPRDGSPPAEVQAAPEPNFDSPAAETGGGSIKTAFESLPDDWKASLKQSIEESDELAGFQSGTISSTVIESQLAYLQRWLITLISHYQRNLELSAAMSVQIKSVKTGLMYRQRDLDLMEVILAHIKSFGGKEASNGAGNA